MAKNDPKVFTFNWHEEYEKDRDSFLSWLWPSLMVDADFEKMMELTEKGKKIHLRIFANDQEVNAKHFLDSLEKNYELAISRRAATLAKEAGLDNLTEMIAEIEKAIRKRIESEFEKIGITIERDEYEW